MLAQSAALTGAVLVGWYLANVFVLLPNADVPSQRDRILPFALHAVVALLLGISGMVVQRWCRLRPRDDEDETAKPHLTARRPPDPTNPHRSNGRGPEPGARYSDSLAPARTRHAGHGAGDEAAETVDAVGGEAAAGGGCAGTRGHLRDRAVGMRQHGPPPEVAAESSPTTLPYVADAPEAFDVRAEAVLAALRADGTLSTYAASLVLLSPRVVETGYPRRCTQAGVRQRRLRGGAGPAGRRDHPDGDPSRREHPLAARARRPRDARAGSARGARLRAVASACPVVVTRAELGTVEADTNHGRVKLPAWQFWAEGLTTPYKVIAVEESALGSLPTTADPVVAAQGGHPGLLSAQPPVGRARRRPRRDHRARRVRPGPRGPPARGGGRRRRGGRRSPA